ncbi:hypothetical protein JD844_024455 [Phrynosoma platyrhinos]|uniref:Uncharacterized protein n=1 Tax=Phrynosoma platyrhinos TaxID=52577 RepID=A0ABQ7SXU8_PHRPL|nr:hypothetical protein JD844_024455 [Phrynosoma platyrhinos]
METKEEKKERRQGYFARLKKKRLAKQNAEATSTNGTTVCRTPTGKDDVISGQTSEAQENGKHSGEKEDYEKKKKKGSQPKDIRRTDLKRFYITVSQLSPLFVSPPFAARWNGGSVPVVELGRQRPKKLAS